METARGREWRFTAAYQSRELSNSPLEDLNLATMLRPSRDRESLANAGRPVIGAHAAFPLNSARGLFPTAYEADPGAAPIKWANRPAALMGPRSLAPLSNTTARWTAVSADLPGNDMTHVIDTG
jgi:hypothetical protein